MLKAVLIDDEEIALDVLEILLKEAGGVSVEGKYIHVAEALERLPFHEPDLVFIDIEMPGMNGLAAAEQLQSLLPQTNVIFVTAYEEYALNAFDVSAFDYLLKPVSKERLVKTLDRCRRLRDALHSEKLPAEPVAGTGRPETPETPAKPPLQLHVLGSMELYGESGRLLTWRTKKTKEMFAYLWHFGGAPVNRHKILDDLWPEFPLNRAQPLLHTTIYQLRSVLKNAGFPEMVMFGDERYWMISDRIKSDADELERMLRQEACPSLIERLLAVYRGDYLEMEYYPWAEHRRFQLRRSYMRYLKQWLPQADEATREAILRQFIKLEPYEAAHYQQLLELLQGRGEQTAADMLREQMEQRISEESDH